MFKGKKLSRMEYCTKYVYRVTATLKSEKYSTNNAERLCPKRASPRDEKRI
jgi:hypothetical protein